MAPGVTHCVRAVRDGEVDGAKIGDKVVRLLRFAARVGALDEPSAPPAGHFDDARVADTIRRAAAAGFVLVRNDRSALPLVRSEVKRLAVVGPSAAVARTMGGESATVFPPYAVSPVHGLRAALGPAVEVCHSVGHGPAAASPWQALPGFIDPMAPAGLKCAFWPAMALC